MRASTYVKKMREMLAEVSTLIGREVVYTYGEERRRILTHVEAARFLVELTRAVVWHEEPGEAAALLERPLAFTLAELEENGAEIDRVLVAIGENYGIAAAVEVLIGRGQGDGAE